MGKKTVQIATINTEVDRGQKVRLSVTIESLVLMNNLDITYPGRSPQLRTISVILPPPITHSLLFRT